ncbi:MAG: T9SS type A sorting domain-containing protein, partial [Bacteroidetes bacterium]|nr:T9SS type A sorting domain-containing protein [Bacteroidota bacterium]
TINLPEIANTFLAGHKIRVDITSSNYSRFDCNLNNGGIMYTAGDTLIATNTIYTNSTYSSYIELPLVDCTEGNIEINTENENVNIFPNPFKDNISVSINNKCGEVNFCFFDITGREILSFSNYTFKHNTVTLNTNNLKQGIYLLKSIDNKGNNIFIKKIIKTE